MSSYTQPQEVEIVKDAFILTKTIQMENELLNRTVNEKFKTQPAAPIHKTLTAPHIELQIPAPPKTNYGYKDYYEENKVLVIACILLLPFTGFLSLLYLEINFIKRKKAVNEDLAQSPEYLKAVEEAKQKAIEEQDRVNKETAEKQSMINAQYTTDLEHYNNVLIPNYKKDLANYNVAKQKKINLLREDIELNQNTLAALYETTKIISITYRDIDLLLWLYNDMATSDHDIRYATELLDRERQLNATYIVGRNIENTIRSSISELESSITNGMYSIYGAIEEGNDELVKMRHQATISNTIAIIQRHNLNKMVKNYTS